jgi:hypothetical protein
MKYWALNLEMEICTFLTWCGNACSWEMQCYYMAHSKNHRKYCALNLKMKISTFLTCCGSAIRGEMVNWVMILHHALQKLYEILGTEFGDGNMTCLT